MYLIEKYSNETKLKVFNGLKERQNTSVYVTNAKRNRFVIEKAFEQNGRIVLECHLFDYNKKFFMNLKTLIAEARNDNVKIYPKEFAQIYFTEMK